MATPILEVLKARFQEGAKDSTERHTVWVVERIMIDANDGHACTEIPPKDCFKWCSDLEGVRDDLEALGFTAKVCADSGEAYLQVEGWASPSATGRCAEVYSLYVAGLKKEAYRAKVNLNGILEKCLFAARQHERRVIFPTPTRYYDTSFELTPYSKALIGLLNAEGLTVIRHGTDSSAVRGWDS